MTENAAIQSREHYDRIREATGHQIAGRLDEAAGIYLALLEENPDDANALHLLGMLSHQAGDAGRAAALIRRAIELIPGFPLFLGNLGQVYLDMNRLDSAEEVLLDATRRAPDMAAPLYGLAECCRRKGELQEAANYIRMVLEREPQHADAIVCLGRVHLASGSAEKALELFGIARKIVPEHFDARFQAARAHFALAAHEASIDLLQGLLEEDPEHTSCYNNLGNAYMGLQQFGMRQTPTATWSTERRMTPTCATTLRWHWSK